MRRGDSVFSGQLAQRHLRHHVGDDTLGEDLADGRVGNARETQMHRPVVDRLQDFKLVGRRRSPGIFFQPAVQLRHGAGQAGEVVELAVIGGFAVIGCVVQDELLGGRQFIALDVFRNHVDLPDVRGGVGAGGTFKRGGEADVGRGCFVDLLQAAISRIGIEDVAELAGDQPLIVAGRGPAEDLVGHGFVLQLRQVFDGGDGRFAVEHDIFVFVLDAAAEAPDGGAIGHAAVQLGAHADADGNAGGFVDGAPAFEQIVISLGAIGITGVRPEGDVVVAGIGNIAVGVGVPGIGDRQVGGGGAGAGALAVHLGCGFVDVPQVVQAIDEGGGREEDFDDAVAGAGVNLG